MLFYRPAVDHLSHFALDDGHGRLSPKADIEPLPLFVENTTVGKWLVAAGGVKNGFGALENGNLVLVCRRAGIGLDVIGLNHERIGAQRKLARDFSFGEADP